MSSINYAKRDQELDNETVAVLCEAISSDNLQLSTVRENLEADLRRITEICGHDKYESETREVLYRIRVRRRVLAEFEGGRDANH